MAKRRWQRGKFSERREPIWEPLLELLPEDIEDFMWMGEVVLTDGTRIQLYKHYWTRRYICSIWAGASSSIPEPIGGAGRRCRLGARTRRRIRTVAR